MSRVAKKPIDLGKVELNVQSESVTVKGPKGTLSLPKPAGIAINVENGVGGPGEFIPPKRAQKAYLNPQFLKSRDARIIRMMCEYLEPLQRFQRLQVRETIVMFGSARARSMATVRPEFDAAQAGRRKYKGKVPKDGRGALEGAPSTFIATVQTRPAQEGPMQSAVVAELPNVTAIPVREVLERVRGVLDQIALAVRLVAAFSIVAGLVVMAGALAITRQQRLYQSVILKVVGATRGGKTSAATHEKAATAHRMKIGTTVARQRAGWYRTRYGTSASACSASTLAASPECARLRSSGEPAASAAAV